MCTKDTDSTDAGKSNSCAHYRQLCRDLLPINRSPQDPSPIGKFHPADEINRGEAGYGLQLQFWGAVGHGCLLVFFLNIQNKKL